MSTAPWTETPSPSTQPAHPEPSPFSAFQWRELLDEDNVALSTVSLVISIIIGLGMLGMAVVVGILAFGG